MAEGYALGQPYSSGRSNQQVVPVASPAAGAVLLFKPDARWIHRVLACVFTLTTSATVASRYVTLEYLAGGGPAFCVDAASALVTASSTQRFAGSTQRSLAEWNTGTDVLFPLTPAFLFPGDQVSLVVANIQAADQLSAVYFLFDRFPTGDAAEPAESD